MLIGVVCFMLMNTLTVNFSLAPFGKDLVQRGGSVSCLANIIWAVCLGWELALIHLISALLLTITIIGIPFAAQSLKLAVVSFAPFGYEIV
jgi:uncharacterized membrane protein YccF (DUF307 family)